MPPSDRLPSRLSEIRTRLAGASPQPWTLPPPGYVREDTGALLTTDVGDYAITVELTDLFDAIPDRYLEGTVEEDYTCDGVNEDEVECPECQHSFVPRLTCNHTKTRKVQYIHELTALPNAPAVAVPWSLDGILQPVFTRTGDRELVRWAAADLEYLLALLNNAARIFVGTVERMPVYVDRVEGGWRLMSGAQAVGDCAELGEAIDRAVRFTQAGGGLVLVPTRQIVGG